MTNVFDLEIQARPELYKKSEVNKPKDILDRSKLPTEFKTDVYLEDFYTKVEDPAMKMVLTFLPNIVARIGKVKRLLDFGAGPTIHVAVSFRHQVEEIYLADYLPQNREELIKWKEGKSSFDWSVPLKMILTQEGNSWNELDTMQNFTRSKVRGIYHCDCFMDQSVHAPNYLLGQFDVVVTIFCTEYCCNTIDEYMNAIKNIATQIKPGGFLIMGGILEETWCSFGGRKFACLYITKEIMLNSLKAAGLHLENDRQCILYEINGMFMICAKKY